MDKILLIDGHNFMWRANVGFKPATTAPTVSDEYVLIFNFFRNLRATIEQFFPNSAPNVLNKCFFVLEGHPQFRYDLYADYKANRRIVKVGVQQENKERFYHHKDMIISLLKHLPITLTKHPLYECDDVIATLVEDMKDEDITILSNDSDFLQLLQKGYKNVKVYNPYKKDYMVAPEYHYVAWKSLNGDKSDNIPGLVGDKTAQKLLADPTKFDKFLDTEENRAQFTINRQLIEFKQIPINEINLEEGTPNFDILKQEFTKMEFNSIINEKSWNKYINTFNHLRF